MATYKYKAVANGTLSRPYRYFRAGEVITSPVELDSPALVPYDQYVEQKSDVIVPYMTINGVKQKPRYENADPVLSQDQPNGKGVPTVPSNAAYDRSMDSVRELEKLMDQQGAAPATTATDPEAELTQGGAGTGNQNVI